jgi:hypothetical protein
VYKKSQLSDLAFYLHKKSQPMRAQKFYDKEGIGYELFIDYEKQSVMLIVDDLDNPENSKLVEFDDSDLDELIIALVDFKNELLAIRNIGNN